MTGDGCGCQNVVEVAGNTWVEDDGIGCGCHNRVRVAGSTWVKDDCQGRPQLASPLTMTKGFEVLDGVKVDLSI